MAVLSDELIDACKKLQQVRQAAATLRAEEGKLREQILDAIETDGKGVTAAGAPVAHVDEQTRKKVNARRLEAMYPEVYEHVYDETKVIVLKIDLG